MLNHNYCTVIKQVQMFGVPTKKGGNNVCQLDAKVKTICNKPVETWNNSS